jgi:predicted SAM-dependent methyltransferase
LAKECAKNCYGVELDRQYDQHYKNNNIEVFHDIKLFNKDIDIIFMFHVLEHIGDPLNLLNDIKDKFHNGGNLIIEVPSADDALLTLYENEEFSNFTYWSPHLFLYNVRTLSDLMKKAGYKINYIKQFQRYNLSNHLYWLSKKKPRGHQIWSFLDSEELTQAYSAVLGKINKCDTIIGSFCL